jgi:hypothetical protein
MVINADQPLTVSAGSSGAMADGTVQTLRCDPDLFALVLDSLGRPLQLGSHARHASAALRRALAARDGGCVFPACMAPPAWTDSHHVKPFKDGGRTELSNLAGLCRRHHGIAHRKGWTMHATADGWYWWRSPSGRTFWSQRHQRQRAGPTPDQPAGEHAEAVDQSRIPGRGAVTDSASIWVRAGDLPEAEATLDEQE